MGRIQRIIRFPFKQATRAAGCRPRLILTGISRSLFRNRDRTSRLRHLYRSSGKSRAGTQQQPVRHNSGRISRPWSVDRISSISRSPAAPLEYRIPGRTWYPARQAHHLWGSGQPEKPRSGRFGRHSGRFSLPHPTQMHWQTL